MDLESIYIERPGVRQKLADVVAQADTGAMQLVWLLGETGQGKTTFIKRFLDEYREQRLTSYAVCSSPLGNQPTTALRPHQPLKDIIEDLLTSKSNFHRHKNLVRNISLTVLACMPIIGEIAYGIKEIRRDLTEYKSGKRKVELDKFEEEYIDTLVQISGDSPLLLAIDDIQWADKQSILVLTQFILGEAVRRRPIAVVLAGRIDEIQQQSHVLDLYNKSIRLDSTVEVRVPVFTSDEVGSYYRMRFPTAQPAPALLLWFEQKTGGNPFFLSSYIKHLLVEEVLSPSGKLISDLSAYKGLPAEIKLVTNWLIKSLSEEELTLLLTASVLGYEFSVHELVHLTQRPVLELIRNMRKIKALYGIIEPAGYKLVNGRESTVYRFTQHAIHTALYNELSVEEKEALHRSVAQYLHTLQFEGGDDPEVLNSIASALALHAHLGKDQQLEYESLLLKARNTTEPLDEDYVRERIDELAAGLGKSPGQLQQDYHAVAGMGPYATHFPEGSRAPVPPGEDPEVRVLREPLTGLVFSTLARMREGDTADAQKLLELRIAASRRRGIEVHPLLVVLLALAAYKEGTLDLPTRDALEALAIGGEPGVYTALARFMLAVSAPSASDETVLRYLTEITGYRGKYEALFRNVVLSVIKSRFADNPQVRAVIESTPLFAALEAGGGGLNAGEFPRIAEMLR